MRFLYSILILLQPAIIQAQETIPAPVNPTAKDSTSHLFLYNIKGMFETQPIALVVAFLLLFILFLTSEIKSLKINKKEGTLEAGDAETRKKLLAMIRRMERRRSRRALWVTQEQN